MGTNTKTASHSREPQIPGFLQRRAAPATDLLIQPSSYQSLLSELCGELGFDSQRTALRWLLEQIESSRDLRRLILVLLQEGDS
jgi:hypothetical protein